MEKYRFNPATGEVYEYSPDHGAYIFCGNLNGRSESQFLSDIADRDDCPYFGEEEDKNHENN